MPRDHTTDVRHQIDLSMYKDEVSAVDALVAAAQLTSEDRARISERAADLVTQIRDSALVFYKKTRQLDGSRKERHEYHLSLLRKRGELRAAFCSLPILRPNEQGFSKR